jgi:protocatechuate 3,4-dioxygenase beta subunit
MTSKNGLLLVFVLLCLGGLVWWLSRGATENPQQIGLAAPGTADKPAAGAEADLSAGDPVPSAAPSAGSRAPSLAAEVGSAAKSKPAAAALGTQLVGRVVDELGRPVAGARVRVNDSSADAFLRAAAREGTLKPREVATDAQGSFSWPGLKPGSNLVSVHADAFAPFAKECPVPSEAVHDIGDLRLTPGAILSGRVVDASGRPVAGATLHLISSDFELTFGLEFLRGEPLAKSAADGSFRVPSLACGPWQILVHSEDHPDRTFKGSADRKGVEESGLLFELELGTTIEGLALNVPTDQATKAKVRALSLEDRGAIGFARGQRTREAEIGPDGHFVVRGLAADQRWQLQLRGATPGAGFDMFRQRARSSPVRAQSGERGVQLRWQQDSGIALQVVDAKTNQPIETLDVSGGQGWRIEPLRGADGRAQKQFPGGKVRLGDMYPSAESESASIELRAPGYADWKRENITLLAENDVDLGVARLEPMPTVVVTVLDAAGSGPIADARVSLRSNPKSEPGGFSFSMRIEDDSDGPEMNDGSNRRRARTDEHGRAALSSFPGEACTLRVEAEGRAPFELQNLQLPQEGNFEQEVRLSAGGAVLVSVTDTDGRPVSGLNIDHRGPSTRAPQFPFGPRSGPELVTDSKGEVLVAHLEVGRHKFRLAEDGGPQGMRVGRSAAFVVNGADDAEEPGWTAVEVLEGAEAAVALQTVPRGSLSGIVREGGVLLAGATLSLEVDNGEEDGAAMFSGRALRIGGFGGAGNSDERTDGEGGYEFEGRKPGKYKLTVEHAARAMPASFPVELRAGENRFDVDLLLTTIEGRVTNHEGQPIAGVRVKAERHRPGNGRRMSFMAIAIDDGGGEAVTIGDGSELAPGTTNADGRYLLRGVTPDVDLVVKAEAQGCQPKSSEPVRLAPGEAKQGVDLSLERGGKLEVEAVDGLGKPVRMAMVTATPEAGGEPKTGMIGQSGVCQLTGLKPGMYRVSVRRIGPPGVAGAKDPAEQTSAVKADQSSTLTFEMP